MEAVTQFFIDWGYLGLFLSAFIAGSILPFSSEAVMIVLTRMAGMVFPEYIETYFFYILFLGGTLFFFVYDFLIFACQKSVDVIVYRIRK